MILCKAKEPTIHNVDSLVAGIILKLNLIKDGSLFKPFTILFIIYILTLRKIQFESQPMSELYVEAASFLNPSSKFMVHVKILSWELTYNQTVEECLFILYNVATEHEKAKDPRAAKSDVYYEGVDLLSEGKNALQKKIKGYEANKNSSHKYPLSFWAKRR